MRFTVPAGVNPPETPRPYWLDRLRAPRGETFPAAAAIEFSDRCGQRPLGTGGALRRRRVHIRPLGRQGRAPASPARLVLAGPNALLAVRTDRPTRVASLEVPVPSAHTGHAALSGAAGIRTIPLRRSCLPCSPHRYRELPGQPPLRSFACHPGEAFGHHAWMSPVAGHHGIAARSDASHTRESRDRGLVGVGLSRRRSWDSALRSVAPARGSPDVSARPRPPAVIPNVHPDGFVGGSAVAIQSNELTENSDRRSIKDAQNRLLGFIPAGNPCRRRHHCRPTADTAMGFGLSQVLGHPEGCDQAFSKVTWSVSLRSRRKAPIRSWAWSNTSRWSGTGCCRRHLIAAGPSAYSWG
jgi:hypothetical protein